MQDLCDSFRQLTHELKLPTYSQLENILLLLKCDLDSNVSELGTVIILGCYLLYFFENVSWPFHGLTNQYFTI